MSSEEIGTMPKIDENINDPAFLHQQLAELINTTSSLPVFAEKTFDLLLNGTSISSISLVLIDTKKDILSFPFTHGDHEIMRTRMLESVNSPLKSVIRKQTPLMVVKADYLAYCDDQSVIDHIPELWSGFPVFKDGHLFAILLFIANSEQKAEILEKLYPTLINFPQIYAPYLETKIRMDTLQGSEVKFRSLVETSIDITFQITRTGYIDYVSSNVESQFGCDPQALIGKHFKVTTPMDQVSKVVDALKNIMKGETIRNMGITQKIRSGELIPMEVSVSPIYRDGEIFGAQGTMRDISERYHAQQEIERLAFFPLANPMPVVEVDLNGVPSYINPAGIQLLDRMNLDMGQVSNILPSDFKSDIRAALSEKNQIPSREVSLEGLHLLWTAFFLQNQNLLHYYATDITNLKRTEIELISAKERAIKNEQVKTLFLANMSHEIRTPLNSILGFTELIEEEVKGKFDANLQAYFEIIHVSGKRLWQTVHQILDISQIETGTFELKVESVNLGAIIKDLGTSFRSIAEQKNINLMVNVPATNMQIISDEYCATQSISNLIDNAIKYTNTGYVKVNIEITDSCIKVIIKDTGIGMSKEYQEQIFKSFSQESTGYTKHFQGVGLGLALAHRYLSLIKSTIEVESEQEVGSTFTISFPLTQVNESADIKPVNPIMDKELDASAHLQNEKMNVLVVEDDPNSQKLAGFTLKNDFTLFFAESVVEAKEQLIIHDIQLILLDLSLKGDEDGLDLARFVRSDPRWQLTPIVALTAHAFTSDRDRCIDAGCNDFMTKPFQRLELMETISKLI